MKTERERYYLEYSSVFDGSRDEYNIPLFKRIIRNAGGFNVRAGIRLGWAFQPKVVIFSATKVVLKNIQYELDALPVFAVCGCKTPAVDWR